MVGGLFLIWKGVKELRHKSKGIEQEGEDGRGELAPLNKKKAGILFNAP
jgi:threonine/homoserine/homoserine lactone efflux protein